MHLVGPHNTASHWCHRALRDPKLRGRFVPFIVLVLLLFVRVEDPPVLEAARLQVLDAYQRLHPRAPKTDIVTIVDVDEASLAALGQWPWPRVHLAELVERLTEAGAVAIGFDIVFSEPDRLSPPLYATSATTLPKELSERLSTLPSNDAVFADVLLRTPVVLGMAADVAGAPAGDRPPAPIATVAEFNGDPRPFLFGFPALIRNIAPLELAARGLGLFTLTPEHDGIVRRVPSAMRVGGQIIPTMALELLRVAGGASHFALFLNENRSGIKEARVAKLAVPTDENGRVWMKFSPHRPDLYLSASEVISGRFDADKVRNKIVLVGTSAAGLRDLRVTPIHAAIPGVEIHAQLLDAVLSQDFLRRTELASMAEIAVTALLGMLLIVVVPSLNGRQGLQLFAVGSLGLWLGAYYSYLEHSYFLDASYPWLATSLVFVCLLYLNFVREEAQKRRIRTAFGQYLSPSLVQELSDHPERLRLGGELRELTFLFTDAVGFTAFVEKTDPQVLVAMLNEYLDGVCQVVMDHGGTIDKIVGDGVHAIFGAPVDQQDHAMRAVACALEIDRFALEFSRAQKARGFNFGATRIGVNSGPAVVGNFGGSQRFDYTAHGDAINIAARLESANQHLGTRVCISKNTVQLCPDLYFRPIGELLLKGKSQGLLAFEPLPPEQARSARVAEYELAYQLLSARRRSAAAAFEELATKYPHDPLVAFHKSRLLGDAVGPELDLAQA